jgi:hypothetical protein
MLAAAAAELLPVMEGGGAKGEDAGSGAAGGATPQRVDEGAR